MSSSSYDSHWRHHNFLNNDIIDIKRSKKKNMSSSSYEWRHHNNIYLISYRVFDRTTVFLSGNNNSDLSQIGTTWFGYNLSDINSQYPSFSSNQSSGNGSNTPFPASTQYSISDFIQSDSTDIALVTTSTLPNYAGNIYALVKISTGCDRSFNEIDGGTNTTITGEITGDSAATLFYNSNPTIYYRTNGNIGTGPFLTLGSAHSIYELGDSNVAQILYVFPPGTQTSDNFMNINSINLSITI